jgi:pyruvate carboxylase subunit B
MRYLVDVNGERLDVVVEGDAVTLDGERTAAHLTQLEGTPVQLVTMVARRGGSRGSYALWIDGWRFDVEALDERTRAIRDLSAKHATAAGPAPVVAPMPGLIVRVQVEVGDTVEAGQGVVVMEAMKMENELRAAAPGVVRAVHATAGKAVEKGTVLVELE